MMPLIISSINRLILPFISAALAAFFCSIVSSFYSKKLKVILSTIINFINHLPSILLIPTLSLFLKNINGIVFLINFLAVFSSFYTQINKEFSEIPTSFIRLFNYMEAGYLERVFKLYLPYSVKGLRTGGILGLSKGWASVITIESLLGIDGLGHKTWKSFLIFDTRGMLIGILLILLVGYLLIIFYKFLISLVRVIRVKGDA